MKTFILLLLYFLVGNSNVNSGYVCGNHIPSHYAKSAKMVDEYTQKYQCVLWSSVINGNISGSVIGLDGVPVINAHLLLKSNSGTVLSTSSTEENGLYTLKNVPTKGTFQLIVSVDNIVKEDTLIDMQIFDKKIRIH